MRIIERLELKVTTTIQAIKQVSAEMTQRKQEFDELREESRVWGVTGLEDRAISSHYSSDMSALRYKRLDLMEQRESTLRELRKQTRWRPAVWH